MAEPNPAVDMLLLADLKAWLNVTTGNDDDLLQKLITNISQRILTKICRDTILSASFTESYDGSGTPMQALLHYPVTAVASLTINDAPIAFSPDGVQGGYVFDKYSLKLVGAGQSWQLAPGYYGPPSTFIKGFQNIKVVYTAGYEEVPDDLSQFVMEWCAFRYRRRGWIGQASKHLSTGESVTFEKDEMAEEMNHAIKPYIRRIPV